MGVPVLALRLGLVSRAPLTGDLPVYPPDIAPCGQSGGTGSGLGTVAVWAGAVEGAACGSNSSSSGLRNEGCLL